MNPCLRSPERLDRPDALPPPPTPALAPRRFRGLDALLLLAVFAAGCSGEARLERRLERARRHAEAGRPAAAIIEYANVLKLDSKNAEAIRQIGYLRFESGEFREAIPFLRATIDLEPTNTLAHLRLGTILLGAGRRDMARDLALRSLEAAPGDLGGMILLADASFGTNDIEHALGILAGAEATLGDQPAYRLATGGLLVRQGRLEEAERAFARALALGEDRPDVHLSLANLHMVRGDRDKARQAFEKAAALSAPDSGAALALAEFRLQSDDFNGARQTLNDALAATPGSPSAMYLLARVAFAEADYKGCLDLVDKVLAKRQDSFPVLLLKANAHLASGDAEAAVADYEKLAASHPKIPRVRLDLARALLMKGDRLRAVAELEQAAALAPQDAAAAQLLAREYLRGGNVAGAIGLLEGLVRQQPVVPAVHALLGAAYAAANRMPEALAVLTALRDARPEDAEAHYLLGRMQRRGGDTKTASLSFAEALRLKSDFLPALTELILIDLVDRDFPRALARVRERIEEQPDNAMLYDLRGRIHMAERDYPRAEEAFLKTVELNPAHPGAYIQLSRVYTAMDRIPEALARLDAALAVRPDDEMTLMMAAGLHTQQDAIAKAAGVYERLLAGNPNFAPAANNLAYLYANRMNRLDDAHKLAQRAREAMPNDPFVADTLGWILYLKGESKWAEALLKESAAQLPEEPEVLHHLGAILGSLGKEKEALDALDRALAAGASFPERAAAEGYAEILRMDPDHPIDQPTVAKLEEVLGKNPGHPAALLRLAATHEQAGQWKDAESRYLELLAAHPAHAGALKRLTQLYLGAIDAPAKAMDAARRLRAQAPDDPDALRLLGRAATRAGDLKWALSLFRDAVKGAPENAALRYGLGQTAYQSGHLREAEQTLERALKLDAASPEAAEARRLLSLMRIYREKDASEQARTFVGSALAEAPLDLSARMAAAAQSAAAGDAAGAQAAYEGIVRAWPNFAPALADLATIYADAKDMEGKAWELASKARELLPEDPTVAALVGGMASRRGQHDWAVPVLSEAVRGGVTNAAVYFALGSSEFRRGNKDAARQHLEEALRRADAGFADAEEARRLLAEISGN